MKKKEATIAKEITEDTNSNLITRKEAIKKTAYIALSAATMMILLSNPQKAQAAETSAAPPPPWQG
jgi:hypothetical protein